MERIALLYGSHHDSALRNFRRETPEQVERILPQKSNLNSLKEYDGIIITGSSSSVLDDKEWIDYAKNLVKEAVEDHSIPTLGVCWGGQLLAHIHGGKVERGSIRELGYRKVYRTENTHPIFKGIQDEFTGFQSHGDYITKIPPEADLLAESDQSIQAFSYKSAVGVQFHPEVDYITAKRLVEKYKDQNTTGEPSFKTVHWAEAQETSDVLRNYIYEMVY